MKLFNNLDKCLCCLKNIETVLDLGEHPLANNFHKLNETENLFPLKLNYCLTCFHCQLSIAIDPTILFKSYKYVSGTSQTGLDFFKENALFIHNYINKENGLILDIACNDGSQLNFFKELGWETYGVDPAENLYEITKKCGHNIICDFWNSDSAKKLPTMDIILAQNVFAHTEKIDDFLQACKLVMNDSTSLFIQTSQKNMILNNEFDTIYHEHISFFNTNSMNKLVLRNGLTLNRVLETTIHGCSYIFEIKKNKDNSIYNIEQQLHREKDNGLYQTDTYNNFNLKSKQSLENLKNEIETYKKNGYICIGFGASAKGQTVICSGNIMLDYIIDENPLKIGLNSPKLNIPIVDLNKFKDDSSSKILVTILAWNFADEIIEKIKSLNKKAEIIIIKRYFPCIEKTTI